MKGVAVTGVWEGEGVTGVGERCGGSCVLPGVNSCYPGQWFSPFPPPPFPFFFIPLPFSFSPFLPSFFPPFFTALLSTPSAFPPSFPLYLPPFLPFPPFSPPFLPSSPLQSLPLFILSHSPSFYPFSLPSPSLHSSSSSVFLSLAYILPSLIRLPSFLNFFPHTFIFSFSFPQLSSPLFYVSSLSFPLFYSSTHSLFHSSFLLIFLP